DDRDGGRRGVGVPGRGCARAAAREVRRRTEPARRAEPPLLPRGPDAAARRGRHLYRHAGRGCGPAARSGVAAPDGGGRDLDRRPRRRPLEPPLRHQGGGPGARRHRPHLFLSAAAALRGPRRVVGGRLCGGGLLDRGAQQRLQLYGRHRRLHGRRRDRQRLLPHPARGPARGHPPRPDRGDGGVPRLEREPGLNVYRRLRRVLPGLLAGRGGPLRPRAAGRALDAFGLRSRRLGLPSLPVRHRHHPLPAPAKRGRQEHLFGPPGAHLPAHNPGCRAPPPHQQPLLRRERGRGPRGASRGRKRPLRAARPDPGCRALRGARGATEAGRL
ncbi:MAG: Undecaprenyl-phosphate alpha-N-acetylglucosaminyl 1-phosphate transferase, partial [uncultured Rubrobacteraceae bacterium]